ncbi:MAG: hypothetical protein ACYDAY_04545 [Candidatus Dormibacteria bacterium]
MWSVLAGLATAFLSLAAASGAGMAASVPSPTPPTSILTPSPQITPPPTVQIGSPAPTPPSPDVPPSPPPGNRPTPRPTPAAGAQAAESQPTPGFSPATGITLDHAGAVDQARSFFALGLTRPLNLNFGGFGRLHSSSVPVWQLMVMLTLASAILALLGWAVMTRLDQQLMRLGRLVSAGAQRWGGRSARKNS